MASSIKFLYFGSELETHCSANEPLLDVLEARGHSVDVINWKFGDDINELFAKAPEVDIILNEVGLAERNNQNKNQVWVCLLHGISAFKTNYLYPSLNRFNLVLVPTDNWVEQIILSNGGSSEKKLFSSVDGWSKLDLYYKYLINKGQARKYIYKKYGFDKNKKLIVYAPTGIRPGYVHLKDWLEKKWPPGGYQNHGSAYLCEDITKTALEYGNFYNIQHPCVDRSDVIADRIPMMVAADLLISDISSMVLEASLMDIPIIQIKKEIDDQLPGDFHVFADPEKEVLDFGDIIDVGDLDKTIELRLEEDAFKERREELRQKYVGSCDGNCAEREADAIENYWKELAK